MWDWLQLLVVPLVLIVIGLGFSMLQEARQQRIENRRATAERALVNQRAQDEALQAYLDQMSQLILASDRNLLEAERGDPVYTLAQARTSTIVLNLGAENNDSVIRFLRGSGLDGSDKDSLDLLREIALKEAHLRGVVLPQADLNKADLREADLRKAVLYGANLSEARLSNAKLNRTILIDTDLSGADLSDADLIGADLIGAKGWTKQQLTKVRTLKGATMPDGQVLKSDNKSKRPTLKEWLKNKDRMEDGENSVP